MPYARPTLTELRQQIAQDIAAGLPGADALLRFGNLKVTGNAQADLAYLHYGYLDWIAKQAVPFTATDEYLQGWAALKNITLNPATQASGVATFPGTPGAVIPANWPVVRGDGVQYATTMAVAVANTGSAAVPITAVADPTGQTGAFGNCSVGVAMTLGQPIAGVQASGAVTTACQGGNDIESNDSLRARMLQAYQTPPQGGALRDYIAWALAVPGVTRAWVRPNGMGAGTVVVYVMLDNTEAALGGFPQGTNGVAAQEWRAVPATGDQLIVANAIYAVQPVAALVYVCSPVNTPVSFSIQGVPAGSRAAVQAALALLMLREGTPGGTIPIQYAWAAVTGAAGTTDFAILSPAADITMTTGQLPTLGAITWS